MAQTSVDRVRDALLSAGHEDTITLFPEGARSAEDAARAVGCGVAQIVKSMIFRSGDQPVLILTSGSNQVDVAKVSAFLQKSLERADGKWVREVTGFAIGGVAPVGHLADVTVLIDQDLMELSPIWAAAGSPTHVFKTEAQKLRQMTDGIIANIRQD